MSDLGNLFWVLGFAGHLALLWVLFRRRRARQFPVFTALILVNVLRTAILYLVRRSGTDYAYFQAYVWLGMLDVLLQLGVVYEVATHVFRPLGGWAPDVRRGLQAVVGGCLAIALGLTYLAVPGNTKWQIAALMKANFFASALLSGLFLGLVVLSVTVGLPWRTHVARISQGLGAYSIFDVIIQAGHTLYGAGYQARIDETLITARMTVYLGALGYWIVTLWKDAPPGRQLSAEMREQLRSLQARLAYDLYTIRHWRKL